MSCRICGRRAKSEFCKRHEEAYKSILEVYREWREAMSISWREYLEEIVKNPYSGRWVKDVASYLLAESEDEKHRRCLNESFKLSKWNKSDRRR